MPVVFTMKRTPPLIWAQVKRNVQFCCSIYLSISFDLDTLIQERICYWKNLQSLDIAQIIIHRIHCIFSRAKKIQSILWFFHRETFQFLIHVIQKASLVSGPLLLGFFFGFRTTDWHQKIRKLLKGKYQSCGNFFTILVFFNKIKQKQFSY